VRRFLHQVLLAICLLHLSGAHWALLQTVAWTGMLYSRVQKSSVAVAVGSTFDGAHPCSLCQAISHAQSEEQQEEPALPQAKFELGSLKAIATSPFRLPAPLLTATLSWPDPAPIGVSRCEEPPVPPPLTA